MKKYVKIVFFIVKNVIKEYVFIASNHVVFVSKIFVKNAIQILKK
jgi:hypothetical protein